MNLLSNALKFTKRGYVNITASLDYEPNLKRNVLQVSIRDTGIGIKREKQDQLFKLFHTFGNQFE